MTSSQQNRKGFTIVELLIVIVVIAILAAISIVAYNGIQNRAKTSASQSAANLVIRKAEAANAVGTSGYPTAYTGFSANVESTLAGSGISFGTPSATTSEKVVGYIPCTSTGARVTYYDNTASAVVTTNIGTPGTCGTALTGGPY